MDLLFELFSLVSSTNHTCSIGSTTSDYAGLLVNLAVHNNRSETKSHVNVSWKLIIFWRFNNLHRFCCEVTKLPC